jgi:D-alanyl-D-alanine carboxypeptidase
MPNRATRSAFLATALAAIGAAAAAQEPSPIRQTELGSHLKAYVDSLAGADAFSGVVLLARGAEPVYQHAWGLADREAGRANTVATRFNLGSINKVFTATVIRQLAAEGRLGLDDTLGRLLPDYPNRDVAARVTIRELLEHRSGVGGNIFAAPAGGTRHDVRSIRDYLGLIASAPLEFEPGTRQQYSNAGYVMLGAVIERLTGRSYYDAVRERVFVPAGMTATGSFAVDSLPANTAIGYTRVQPGMNGPGAPATGPWRRNTDLLPGRGSSAGGGYSTAADLLRFVVASHDGRVAAAPRGIGVAGGAPGLNAALEEDLPGGYHLVVLANLDPPAAERVARAVRGWVGAGDVRGVRAH